MLMDYALLLGYVGISIAASLLYLYKKLIVWRKTRKAVAITIIASKRSGKQVESETLAKLAEKYKWKSVTRFLPLTKVSSDKGVYLLTAPIPPYERTPIQVSPLKEETTEEKFITCSKCKEKMYEELDPLFCIHCGNPFTEEVESNG
jgi:formylmethanofuran dehydrogenase subunit E